MGKTANSKRLADFAAYIVIGLAVGLVALIAAEHAIDFKWIALFFETVLVFGSGMRFVR